MVSEKNFSHDEAFDKFIKFFKIHGTVFSATGNDQIPAYDDIVKVVKPEFFNMRLSVRVAGQHAGVLPIQI